MTTEIKPFTSRQLAKITNDNLTHALLRKENVEPLEEIILTKVQRLNRLVEEKVNGKIRYTSPASREELQAQYKEVRDEVNSFLGIEPENYPTCNNYTLFGSRTGRDIIKRSLMYSGVLLIAAITPFTCDTNIPLSALQAMGALYGIRGLREMKDTHKTLKLSQATYSGVCNEILLSRQEREKNIFCMCHEYAHGLLDQMGMSPLSEMIPSGHVLFHEGFAGSVENNVSQTISEKRKNRAFSFDEDLERAKILNMSISYSWLMDYFKIKPKGIYAKYAEMGSLGRKIFGEGEHALGSSLFYLAEARHGKGIYRDVLRGDFSSISGARE